MFIFFGLDWRKHKKVVEDKSSGGAKNNKTELYEDLKKSVRSPTTLTELNELSIEHYMEAPSAEQSKKMIVNINTILDKKKALITAHYCTLGLELANLKSMCYINVCADCTSDVDKYVTLSCNKCGKNKVNAANTREYFSWCTSALECTKDWVNFLICLGRLCTVYPKFKHCTMSLDKMKANMKLFQNCMKDDSTFWQISNSS